MRYHINDQQQVRRCRAKTRCRFGGADGSERHFTTVDEAERHLVRLMGHDPDSSFGKSLSKTPSLASLSAKGVRLSKVESVVESPMKTGSIDESEVVVLDGKMDRELVSKIKNGEVSFTL